jgi:hypothetical protein
MLVAMLNREVVMRAWWPGLAGAGVVAIVGLSAQVPATGRGTAAADQQTAGDSGKPGASKSITVDGCVQTAPPSATGSKYILLVRPGAGRGAAARGAGAGTATAGAGDGAEASGGGAAAGGGATGGRAGAPAGPVRYRLDGDEKLIAPHLNHVVEVRGALQGAPPAGGAKPGATPGAMQVFKMESLKMVAAVC